MFSKKQIQAIQSEKRILILDGAVRSGKSFSADWILAKMARTAPEGSLLLSGRSIATIKRNVIDDLYNIFDQQDVQYFPGKQELRFFGRQIYCVGASDMASEGRIRGATFSGALVDEASLIPEGFFKMLTTRLSKKGARLVATTNPDNPGHWLKKDYIDKPNEYVDSIHFVLDDNPSLDDEMKNMLKSSLSGMFYERFINGKWCLAEGLVYSNFNEDYHVINSPPATALYYLVGIDYGTANPTAFCMIGVNEYASPPMWVEKEYYFSSAQMGYMKTDYEYADDLERFIDGYNLKGIYIDPSAVSFRIELRKRGVKLIEAVNDVVQGIRVVAQFIHDGSLKICRNCDKMIEEFQSYVWDVKASERGLDKPIKANDHLCVTGDTKIMLLNGKEVEIQELALKIKRRGSFYNYCFRSGRIEGDTYVNPMLTRQNADVIKITLEDGKELKATPDHQILTDRGLVPLQNVGLGDLVITASHRYLAKDEDKDAYFTVAIRVISIEKCGKEDVYCLGGQKNGTFIANGIIVKNCDSLRYVMATRYGFSRRLKPSMLYVADDPYTKPDPWASPNYTYSVNSNHTI